MLSFGDYSKQTNSESIIKPAPPLPSLQPIFFSIQCCHNEGKAPSFALVLWIDDSCYGTFVDWILTLKEKKKRVQCEYNSSDVKLSDAVNKPQLFSFGATLTQYDNIEVKQMKLCKNIIANKKKPAMSVCVCVHIVCLCGHLEATVWSNITQKGV